MGGIIGSNIFLAREKPSYPTAYKFETAITASAICVAILQAYLLYRENGKRAVIIAKAEEEGRDLDAEYKDAGDKNPYYKYTL